MALSVFPLKYSIITSNQHALQIFALTQKQNFVLTPSSFQVSVVSGGTLNVSAGICMIAGCMIESTSADTLNTDQTQTRHIYIQLVRDGNGRPTSAQYVVVTSGLYDTDPDYLKLAVVSGTTVTDVRRLNQRFDVMKITATTSTTINFGIKARAVFIKVKALGGGRGGRRGTNHFGGDGGGFAIDKRMALNVDRCVITIGAGGSGRSTDGHGNQGGDTIVELRDGTTTKVSIKASGGKYLSSDLQQINYQKSNWYGFDLENYFSSSTNRNLLTESHWTHVPSLNGDVYQTPFSAPVFFNTASDVRGMTNRVFFGGGNGGYPNINSNNGQPSAYVWGGAGGTASASGTAGNGQVPAGGGGNTDTGTSGAGARGEAIVEMIIIY